MPHRSLPRSPFTLAVVAALFGALLMVGGPSAASSASFVGDWETGTYSQWGDLQYEFARPVSASFQVVTSPVRQGQYAARFTAKQAYSPFGWKESTEVGHGFSDQGQGSDYYYGFSLLFPSTWSDPYGWALVTQFYTKTFWVFYGPPPISIDAGGNRLGLHINTGLSPISGGSSFQWEYSRYLVIAPTLSLGQWNDIIMHVRWAANPSTGVLEVWHRVGSGPFSKVISLSGIPTLRYNPDYNGGQPDPIGLIKQGIYRNSKCNTDSRGNIGEVQAGDLCQYGAWGSQPDTIVYHDGFVRAGSFEEVAAALGSGGSTSVVSAPLNTSLPTISGTLQEGKTLTASSGSWSGSPTSYAYQWRRCDSSGASCADIAGATGSSYLLASADVGKTLRVVVTATNSAGSSSATSAATALVQAAGTSGSTTTSGFVTNVVAGATIVTPFTWTFSPGEPAVKGYFWADGKLLASQEGPGPYTWTLPAGLLSSGSHLLGHSWDTPDGVRHAPASAYSVTIANPTTGETSAPLNTSLPTISGTPQEGKTLTASSGSWSGSPTSYAYQWRRCDSSGASCADIAGATGSSYLLASADVGKTLRVVVTATNSAGSSSASSLPTAPVAAAVVAPQVTALPTISGPTVVGKTLTASSGSWSGSPTSYAYQWRRCDRNGASCADIVGAVAQSYVLTGKDEGATLRVVVTASNAGGSTPAISEPSKIVR